MNLRSWVTRSAFWHSTVSVQSSHNSIRCNWKLSYWAKHFVTDIRENSRWSLSHMASTTTGLSISRSWIMQCKTMLQLIQIKVENFVCTKITSIHWLTVNRWIDGVHVGSFLSSRIWTRTCVLKCEGRIIKRPVRFYGHIVQSCTIIANCKKIQTEQVDWKMCCSTTKSRNSV